MEPLTRYSANRVIMRPVAASWWRLMKVVTTNMLTKNTKTYAYSDTELLTMCMYQMAAMVERHPNKAWDPNR